MSREELELRPAGKNAAVHRGVRGIPTFAATESAANAAIRGAAAGARDRLVCIGQHARN